MCAVFVFGKADAAALAMPAIFILAEVLLQVCACMAELVLMCHMPHHVLQHVHCAVCGYTQQVCVCAVLGWCTHALA